ncbi:MAG: zinc-ribbon domain-containing protein [Acidobacteria bacterium]|nr:MAG: zinc-ribbon domain-containing protein [Acidobacteriota bacterium]
MNKTCPSCGNAVSQHAAFCRSCGARLASEAPAPGPAVQFEAVPPPVFPPPSPRSAESAGGRLCPCCGASTGDAAAFCRNCGASIAPPANAKPPGTRRSSPLYLILPAGAACILLLLLGIAAVSISSLGIGALGPAPLDADLHLA